MGGWPTNAVKRSARAERESPTSRASASSVHARAGLACSAESARPTNRSRRPASQSVRASGSDSR